MSFNSTVGAGAVSGFLDGGSVAGFEVEAVLSAFSGVFALVLDDFYDIVFVGAGTSSREGEESEQDELKKEKLFCS